MFSQGFYLNPDSLNFGASNPTGAYFQQGGGANSGLGPSNPFDMQNMGGLGSGLGFNLGTGQLVLGGIGTLGNLWNSWRAHNLAQDQFDYQKDVINTNLRNQIQAYNTRLAGLARNRAYLSGQDPSSADEYIEENRLRR